VAQRNYELRKTPPCLYDPGREMIFTDPIVVERIQIPEVLLYGLEALFAVGVIIVGKLWLRWRSNRKP